MPSTPRSTSGVVDDLSGNGVKLELGFVALDGHGFDWQEIEDQRAIGAGGERDHFVLVGGICSLHIRMHFFQVCGLSALGGTVINDFNLNLFFGLIDNGHT